MTKMANSNSHVGYIALLRQPAFLCTGWLGDRSIYKCICILYLLTNTFEFFFGQNQTEI